MSSTFKKEHSLTPLSHPFKPTWLTGYTSVLIVSTVVVAPAVVLALAETALVANAMDVVHPYRPGTSTKVGIAGGEEKEIKKRSHTHTCIAKF